MKQFLCKRGKRKHLLFSLIMLCVLSSCKKDQKQHLDAGIQINPAMQRNISGLYKSGTYSWERYDNNGYFFNQDDTARINVEFISGDQIKLQLLTSSPVPAIKSYNVYCRDTTPLTPNVSYYKFHKILDSTTTHFSSILIEIRYYGFLPLPQSDMTWSYKDYTITNGQYGIPLLQVTGSNFRK
jgi:hypothetical protein